jgi:peptide/nickel transport system permease protein
MNREFAAVVKLAGRALWRAFTGNGAVCVGSVLFLIIVVLAVAAPLIAPYDPIDQDIVSQLQGPSAEHWFGTDQFGRDTLSRLLYGARPSLIIGVLSVVIAATIGTLTGLVAGYLGGAVDVVVMQVMDVLLAFPSLILGLMMVAMLGPNLFNIIVAIAVTAVPPFARIARAPVIALREREFVHAARALGFSPLRIMLRHILPGILPDVLVMASLWMATAIRTEASLAFVGLGLKPPIPSWGGMIREGFENILDSPSLALFPSLAVLAVVLTLNILGDGLRDAIDPALRTDA